MDGKLSLNLDDLSVDTFSVDAPEDATLASIYPQLPQVPTTSPCLDSLQTCDPRCIA